MTVVQRNKTLIFHDIDFTFFHQTLMLQPIIVVLLSKRGSNNVLQTVTDPGLIVTMLLRCLTES